MAEAREKAMQKQEEEKKAERNPKEEERRSMQQQRLEAEIRESANEANCHIINGLYSAIKDVARDATSFALKTYTPILKRVCTMSCSLMELF